MRQSTHIRFAGMLFLAASVDSSAAWSIDEARLAARYALSRDVDWSWELECSTGSGDASEEHCYFYASPAVSSYDMKTMSPLPYDIDQEYRDNFYKIIEKYESISQLLNSRPYFILEINSIGGDVEASLQIGRTVRDLHGDIRIGENDVCVSSCVLILMGAETRYIDGMVGIHRPFLNYSVGDNSPQTIKKITDVTRDVLVSYALEMNVSAQIIDDMFVVPSEAVRWLSSTEIDNYGLLRRDPVASEAERLREAQDWGLTASEFMARKAKLSQLCTAFDGYDLCYRDVMSGRR